MTLEILRSLIWFKIKSLFNVAVFDPWADPDDAKLMYSINVENSIPSTRKFSAIIVAVSHQEFVNIKEEQWLTWLLPGGIVFDLKGIVPRSVKPVRL